MDTRTAASLVLLAFAAADPAPASADPAAWTTLLAAPAGAAFTFAGGGAERQQVSAAIEQAIAEMSFVVRPFARSRLTAGNRVCDRLSLRLDGGDLVVDRDGSVVRSPADGQPGPWTGSDGKVYVVRQELRGGALIQRFTAEDGERTNTLTLSPDASRLRLAVEVRSGRLPAPLVYALEYLRAQP